MKVQKLILTAFLLFVLTGCASFTKLNTTYLISKDRTWIIPKDTPFKALGDDKKIQEYSINADLLVIYKGRYLELEKEANIRALKIKKDSKKNTAIFSGLGTLLGALIAYFFKKKKK